MKTPLILHTYSPAFGVPDPSPFPVKVMIFLKIHGLECKRVAGDVRKAPLKKIPFLQHGDRTIPDSELILNYLETEFNLAKDDLSPEQHSTGHFLCRSLEERTYWAFVYFRWLGEESFPVLREVYFAGIPSLLRRFIAGQIQKGIRTSLHGQGLGRHSEETIAEFMRADFRALSEYLGDKAYLFGDKPTRYDCSALAIVSMAAMEGLPTKEPKVFEEFPDLKAYWERAKEAYFPRQQTPE